MAHAYIDAVAEAGAGAIKFQTHIAAAETTRREPWRIKFSRQDDTRYDYWRRMEFTEAQWVGLAEHCADVGLLFMSTPFSPEAVDLLDRVGMPAWKIGGAEVSNLPLIEKVAALGKPVILSSGMAPWSELDAAVEAVRSAGSPVAVMQCSSFYPCPADKVGLNNIAEMQRRYGCVVGLSDHSATPYAGLAAVALGAHLVEIHVVMHRKAFGPDTSTSLTLEELAQLVEGSRFIGTALDNPTDKDALARDFSKMRTTFGKSIVARHDLEAGTVLSASEVALKKPGEGLPPSRLSEVLGKTLTRAVAADDVINAEDLQP